MPVETHTVECFCEACDRRRAERRRLTGKWLEKLARDYAGHAIGGPAAVEPLVSFHLGAFARLAGEALARGEHIAFLDS